MNHRTGRASFEDGRRIVQSVLAGLDLAETTLAAAPGAVDLPPEVRHPHALHEFFAALVLHQDPRVRLAAVAAAEPVAAWCQQARDAICWLLSDDEDFVVFEAVRAAGRARIGEAVEELMAISGPPSVRGSRKPVGVGAALVAQAMYRIFGTPDFNLLEKREEAYRASGELPDGTAVQDGALYSPSDLPGAEEMVLVPVGPFLSGIDADRFTRSTYDLSDVVPSRMVYLADFLIDRYPVTNREYDDWAAGDAASRHELCHPDEPDNKDHRRASRFDPRLGNDHPVVGVDWFDAYAYLMHHGKELPSELEWEKAARGADGRLFPWGDEWDPVAARWAGAVFDCEVTDLEQWRDLLRQCSLTEPEMVTEPVDARPAGLSPYGVWGMVGNAWEWTRTNFTTRRAMQPRTYSRPRPEWATAPESFPVIKGGAWSSMPEETSAYFRGKDLLTDRHNEISFRGVIR